MLDIALSPRLGPPLIAVLLVAGPVQAQIVTDGSVGPKVSLSGGEIKIGPDLGTQKGANLFHSFERFGIATGQTATFTGPGDIKNVISRVTGGEVSNIDGTLASEVGQADLYFLNPAGVIFGPNAQLDVPGSFHVSTAHELRFADGTRFSALDKTGSGLTVAPPEAFGFLDRPPGHITVDQSQLSLKPGKTLSLVGGDIDIIGKLDLRDTVGGIFLGGTYKFGTLGFLEVNGGEINLTSVASAGQVGASDGTVAAERLGTVRLTNGAYINASPFTSSHTWETSPFPLPKFTGSVRIRGGTVVIEGSSIFAHNMADRNDIGGIDLQADLLDIHDSLINNSYMSNSYITTYRAPIRVRAERMVVSGGIGSGGPQVRASGGMVTINAGELELRNGGQIVSENLDVKKPSSASNTVISDETDEPDDTVIPDELDESGDIVIPDELGDIVIPDELSDIVIPDEPDEPVIPDGTDFADSTDFAGDTGAISIRVGHLFISGDHTLGGSGIFSFNQFGNIGSSGPIEIVADIVELRNGGEINASTFDNHDAGIIKVKADRLFISGDGAQGLTGIISSAEPGSTGSGGTITINARAVQLREGGTIAVQSSGHGKSGSISMTAADTVQFDRARVLAETTEADAGSVTLAAGRLFDLQNSTVTTSVAGGTGSGGNIFINSHLMVLDHSQIQANAKQSFGGNITIRAGQLIRTPNNVITASGNVAGNITITAPNTDVSSSLTVLPETFLDASSQLRETCAARGGRPASSFAPGGRGGLPPDPGSPLTASSFEQPPGQQTATGSPTALTAKPRQAAKPVMVAGIPQPVLGSPRLTCRG